MVSLLIFCTLMVKVVIPSNLRDLSITNFLGFMTYFTQKIRKNLLRVWTVFTLIVLLVGLSSGSCLFGSLVIFGWKRYLRLKGKLLISSCPFSSPSGPGRFSLILCSVVESQFNSWFFPIWVVNSRTLGWFVFSLYGQNLNYTSPSSLFTEEILYRWCSIGSGPIDQF